MWEFDIPEWLRIDWSDRSVIGAEDSDYERPAAVVRLVETKNTVANKPQQQSRWHVWEMDLILREMDKPHVDWDYLDLALNRTKIACQNMVAKLTRKYRLKNRDAWDQPDTEYLKWCIGQKDRDFVRIGKALGRTWKAIQCKYYELRREP